MRSDSRLSRMLHVLIHMNRHDGPMTSDAIAAMLSTNPVVVRRTMAGLREAGHVRSEKGHGGGWTLARPLADITLLDVHRAVGDPAIFAIGLAHDNPDCLVEQAVDAALAGALAEAEAVLRARLAAVTLQDLAEDFERRLADIGLAGPACPVETSPVEISPVEG
ncbi:Rrf2 family transcriptional regulator (plasmid) [Tistrella mobilis]|uniref:Rrf2 family transcriptional regulator n=1 Tax=Tistrella mobilis TaxID=171437 RepID=UPI0035587481